MLTCYDASFASLLDDVSIECLLIGDSLGMVVQGHDSTLPVTLDEVAYHTRCVARGARHAWIIADMPFATYQTGTESAFANAARLMQVGARMVKLEGGAWLAPTVTVLTRAGIPVCAHLGLTPQSVFALGGYRVQGRTPEAAERLIADALALQEAGATMLVLEMVPAALADEVTRRLSIPTIGIGAGVGCSGQIQVAHDLLGLYTAFLPKHAKRYAHLYDTMVEALATYAGDVREGRFPGEEHSAHVTLPEL